MSKKILIADDSINVRLELADLLMEDGYEVIASATPDDTLDMVHKHKPDLVLLDTRMPFNTERDEICRKIKQVEGIDVKIIIYTGYIDAVDAVKAKNVGADDYVGKTADFSTLIKS